MSGTAQFEGRTAEEAVARARAALGDAGALRCWKTRRGGVGGFFAKEVFVAGLTPPPGSETTRSRASRAEPGEARGGSDGDHVPHAAPYDGTTPAAGQVRRSGKDKSVGPEDHLSGLVEATSDQVSLGSLAIPSEAFDEVLAEAEAALTREREGNDVTIPPHAARIRSRGPSPRRSRASPSQSPHLPTTATPGSRPTVASTAIAASAPESSDGGERPASAPPAKKAIPTEAKGPTHATEHPDRRRQRSTNSAVVRRAFPI